MNEDELVFATCVAISQKRVARACADLEYAVSRLMADGEIVRKRMESLREACALVEASCRELARVRGA